MGAINVSIDARKLDDVTRMLADIKNGVPKALVGAVNDTARATVTQISKSIRERVNIKKKDIDKNIRRTNATPARMSARITLSETKRLGLKYFGAKQTKIGVSYRIDKAHSTLAKSGKIKHGARGLVRHAFIGSERLGGHVFKRIGPKEKGKKQKLIKLQGISPWGAFVMSGGRRKTQQEANALLAKNLDRRVNFLLLKHSGAIK